MIPQKANIFCIIVHFGASRPTRALLEQLRSGPVTPSHIVIVDHAEESLRVEAAGLPVSVVRPATNRGYAAGVNYGLAELSRLPVQPDDIVLVSNNDITVEAGTLANLSSWWQKQQQPILAAHRLGHINLVTGRAHVAPLTDANIPFAIPYAHGSLLVASVKTWEKIGRMPESYFLYWEDAAVSMQAHAADIGLRQLPEIGVRHEDAQESPPQHKRYYLVRNGAAFLERSTPGAWPLYWTSMNTVRLAYHRLAGHQLVAQALADRKRV